jgi:hypothetical protein
MAEKHGENTAGTKKFPLQDSRGPQQQHEIMSAMGDLVFDPWNGGRSNTDSPLGPLGGSAQFFQNYSILPSIGGGRQGPQVIGRGTSMDPSYADSANVVGALTSPFGRPDRAGNA